MNSQPTEHFGVSVRFRSNWNLRELVFEERGNGKTRRKISRSKGENQQQTQPTYDVSVWYGNIGCLPWGDLQNVSGKSDWKMGKWNTTFWVFPAENFWEQRNI